MNVTEYSLPLPLVTPESAPYWEGCRRHQLLLRFCQGCETWYFYPRDICPKCGSRDVAWRQASGRAILHTYAIVHQPPMPAFVDRVPYVTAIVELAEGPRMATNIVGVKPDPSAIRIGMELRVFYEDVATGMTLPKFGPA
jgi:uncharacterized OB-fold protein